MPWVRKLQWLKKDHILGIYICLFFLGSRHFALKFIYMALAPLWGCWSFFKLLFCKSSFYMWGKNLRKKKQHFPTYMVQILPGGHLLFFKVYFGGQARIFAVFALFFVTSGRNL